MFKKLTLLAVFALPCIHPAAQADTFQFTNVTIGSNGIAVGTVTGSVDIDTSTNVATSFNASVNITADGKTYSFVSNSLYVINPFNGSYELAQYAYNQGPAGANAFSIIFPPSTLSLCTDLTGCTGPDYGASSSEVQLSNGTFACGPTGCTTTPAQDDGTYHFLTGSLVNTSAIPAAATPEPSSLVLLGTGILGLATARRRLLNS